MFQEAQELHQLPANQVFQEDPAGWRGGAVSWQVWGETGIELCLFEKLEKLQITVKLLHFLHNLPK